jgi:hypothetical protein
VSTSPLPITFTVPELGDQPHIFRREFLHQLRLAIGRAQSDETLDTERAVEMLRALSGSAPAGSA